MWSSVLQKEGWEIPKPSGEAYNVSWCGWGYEFNVTPAEMLGTVPKLKEFGIKWATLDDRWFDTYGDWNPRSDTFPGDSIKKMTDDFHKQGMLVQLWWLPLGVEDGQGRWESHKYIVSKIAQEHPEWLILDKDGKHARMTRDLAALCPAVPEVQAYFKKLTEKFIGEWGFDGSKLDNIYSVPMCYNPAHHHKSPQDSVNAMADVYKTIFQTSRALKPESVTQSCPCGTPPSLAWLPFIDQAVTADPVGAVQVRRRIKMYKALLGPESAVYGDHVELSTMDRIGNNWREHGEDFASTIGAGGVVGTKFVWPDPGPKYKAVALTPAKEEHWKKWIGIYNQKMLSKGTFRNLYVYGYDTPEGYAIEKDGKMYYAFFAPSAAPWKGEVELRGLTPGSYQVTNYDQGKSLGTVEATRMRLPAQDRIQRSPAAGSGKVEHVWGGALARRTQDLCSVFAQEAFAIFLIAEGFGASRPGHGKSAGAIAAGQARGRSEPRRYSCRNPASKLSPAPTASTAVTFSAGLVKRSLPRCASAPSWPSFTTTSGTISASRWMAFSGSSVP